MPKRLTIAVDCDDVLIATQKFLVDTYNRKYETTVAVGTDYHSPVWGVEYDLLMQRFGEIAQSDEFKGLQPDIEAVRVLLKLAPHHSIHLVTARKEEERVFTEAALEAVLPGAFQSMHFLGWKGVKGEVCHLLGADILIDDNAHHLHSALESGLPEGGALLFGDYVWNRVSHDDSRLRFCIDWVAVERAIDDLAKG